MADIIDFYEAKSRLRPETEQRAFLVVELPVDVIDGLGESDRPEWVDVLDYLIYGKNHPPR